MPHEVPTLSSDDPTYALQDSADESFEFNFTAFQSTENFTSDEEEENQNEEIITEVDTEYQQIPSDEENENQSQQPIVEEFSPKTKRRNQEAMEEFDRRYQQEMAAAHAEATGRQIELPSVVAEEIKMIVKNIPFPNVPEWAKEIPEDKWIQLIKNLEVTRQ